tara:strand:+ start:389 stop:868 length:480 start_codon:yes stop_codon:yes gene_type:complete
MNNSCTDVSTFEFYNSYHTHPINKFLHLLGIPSIMLSSLVLLNNFHIYQHPIPEIKIKISLSSIVVLFYCLYYYSYGLYPGIVMHIYLTLMNFIQYKLKFSNKNASYIFIMSWGLQFIGHFIEGNRPALTDSIGQAFLGAPIFSLTPIIPGLKKALLKT